MVHVRFYDTRLVAWNGVPPLARRADVFRCRIARSLTTENNRGSVRLDESCDDAHVVVVGHVLFICALPEFSSAFHKGSAANGAQRFPARSHERRGIGYDKLGHRLYPACLVRNKLHHRAQDISLAVEKQTMNAELKSICLSVHRLALPRLFETRRARPKKLGLISETL